jgi:hypothetical protein
VRHPLDADTHRDPGCHRQQHRLRAPILRPVIMVPTGRVGASKFTVMTLF